MVAEASGFDQATNYSWLIADFNNITGFPEDAFIVNTSRFTNTYDGVFSIVLGTSVVGGNYGQLCLDYTAITEPHAILLGCLGLAPLLRRRRA